MTHDDPGAPPRDTTAPRARDAWRRLSDYAGASGADGEPLSLRQRALRMTVLAGGVLGLILVLVVGGYLFTITRDLPGVETFRNYAPPITTRVYAGNGTVLGEYARERRIFVPIAFVPKLVIQAFTSAEDGNFYNHPGIDPSGIARAAIKDVFNVVRGRRLEGASTITQQVARNFLLNSDVKFSRKIREAILAVKIDATYSKDKILELYLNEIFLGKNSYGVAAASLNYFGKSLDELDIAEVAFLASLPKAPSNYDPQRRMAAALARRNWVIGQMADNGYITDAQARAAIAAPLVTQSRPLGSQAEDADYFVEEVRRELYGRYGAKTLYDGGLQVRSTLDTGLQNYAVSALRTGLVRYDRRHGWRGAKKQLDMSAGWRKALAAEPNASGIDTWVTAVVLGFNADRSIRIGLANGGEGKILPAGYVWARRQLRNMDVGAAPSKPQDVVTPGDFIYVEQDGPAGVYGLRQVPEINGAIVAMDPHTGRVLALSGGFSYASSQFDRAMQAMRQPGSSFKPFVYATALDNGYTPVSKVLDAPFVMEQGPGLPLWRPENFEHEFLGMATLRRGIELSHNLMTIRLAQAVGMDKVKTLVEEMGVYPKFQPLLSNSIGSAETTLLRLAIGYSEFVNGGKKVTPSLIDRVQDRNGTTIWKHDNRNCEGCNVAAWTDGQQEPLLTDPRAQVVDPRTAYQIVSLLEGVVLRGTGRSIAVVGKPLGGKTGTSNDAKDVWFVGFSPDLVAGVFVGFDQARTLGRREQGATVAAPIFRDFMKGALANKPATPFRVAPGIELVAVDYHSGGLATPGSAGSVMEAFKEGTAPGEANAPVDLYTGDAATAAGAPGTPGNAPAANVGEGTGGLY